MTFRLTGAIAILAMVALPALAQTPTAPSSPNSGAGVGRALQQEGQASKSTAEIIREIHHQLQDTSKTQGKPGSKSGPAVKAPCKE